MLVLTRKLQQQIHIGDDITITVIQVKGQTVRIGIEAPRDTRVLRAELPKRQAADGEVQTVTVKNNVSVNRLKQALERQASVQTGAVSGPLASKLLTRRAPGADPAPRSSTPERSGPALLFSTING